MFNFQNIENMKDELICPVSYFQKQLLDSLLWKTKKFSLYIQRLLSSWMSKELIQDKINMFKKNITNLYMSYNKIKIHF